MLGARLLDWPHRLGGAVTAITSVMSALFINQRPIHQAIAAVEAPALLLRGDQDSLITQSTIDDLTERRPDWTRCTLDSAGHLLSLEATSDYVRAVHQWLAKGQSPS